MRNAAFSKSPNDQPFGRPTRRVFPDENHLGAWTSLIVSTKPPWNAGGQDWGRSLPSCLQTLNSTTAQVLGWDVPFAHLRLITFGRDI